MNPEERKSPRLPAEEMPGHRERQSTERPYRAPANRFKRGPYRPMRRGSEQEEYPPYRMHEGRPDRGNPQGMRSYRSYPPEMYSEYRYPPYRREPRREYEAYPRRRPEAPWSPYYNEPRHRPYYKKRQFYKEPVPVNILGVFGLDSKATEEDLKEWVREKLGESLKFTRIELILDKYTGFSKGYAFIYFSSVDEATAAKELLSEKNFNGHPVRVEYSITPGGHKEKEKTEQTAELNTGEKKSE